MIEIKEVIETSILLGFGFILGMIVAGVVLI